MWLKNWATVKVGYPVTRSKPNQDRPPVTWPQYSVHSPEINQAACNRNEKEAIHRTCEGSRVQHTMETFSLPSRNPVLAACAPCRLPMGFSPLIFTSHVYFLVNWRQNRTIESNVFLDVVNFWKCLQRRARVKGRFRAIGNSITNSLAAVSWTWIESECCTKSERLSVLGKSSVPVIVLSSRCLSAQRG